MNFQGPNNKEYIFKGKMFLLTFERYCYYDFCIIVIVGGKKIFHGSKNYDQVKI